MLARIGILLTGLVIALPAAAQEMNADQARRFVVGKVFAYNCFDGTKGAGRIFADGSVAGTVQMSGNGTSRFMTLPTNTLRVNGQRVCASLKGMPFEPCFNLTRTDANSFRGSISGFGFAYCDFVRRGRGRSDMIRTATREQGRPLALRSSIAQ
jgi:hypothetical protein